MERLTNSIDYCQMHCDFGKATDCMFSDKSKCYENNIYNRLREYEIAEEQGLILMLSVKPGDIVYCLRHAVPTGYYNCGVERWLQTDNELIPARVVSVKVTKGGKFMKLALRGNCLVKKSWEGEMETYENYEYCHYTMTMGALGKTVFLTKEEAEQALKQMGE